MALFLGGEHILKVVDSSSQPSLVTAYTGVATSLFFLSLWPAQWIRYGTKKENKTGKVIIIFFADSVV